MKLPSGFKALSGIEWTVILALLTVVLILGERMFFS